MTFVIDMQFVNRAIKDLPHEHCSWDVPGGCDGICDCWVGPLQDAWSRVMAEVAALRAFACFADTFTYDKEESNE